MAYDEREASGEVDNEQENEQEMEEQVMEEELANESDAASLEPRSPGVVASAGRFAGSAVRTTGSALSGLGRIIMPSTPSFGEAPEKADPAADDLDDLFEGPQPEDNDMAIDHLVNMSDEDIDDLVGVPEEEELDDLFDVPAEDIMGEVPPPKVRRTGKPYITRWPPPAGLGGMR